MGEKKKKLSFLRHFWSFSSLSFFVLPSTQFPPSAFPLPSNSDKLCIFFFFFFQACSEGMTNFLLLDMSLNKEMRRDSLNSIYSLTHFFGIYTHVCNVIFSPSYFIHGTFSLSSQFIACLSISQNISCSMPSPPKISSLSLSKKYLFFARARERDGNSFHKTFIIIAGCRDKTKAQWSCRRSEFYFLIAVKNAITLLSIQHSFISPLLFMYTFFRLIHMTEEDYQSR